MKKALKRIWLALRGKKPRVWHFAEKDIPQILRRYDDFRRTASSEARYRLFREIEEHLPEVRGQTYAIKTNGSGEPYLEEVL